MTDNINLKKRSPRKPTLLSVDRQAKKARIPVEKYEVKPDGTIIVHRISDHDIAKYNENPWLADIERLTKQ